VTSTIRILAALEPKRREQLETILAALRERGLSVTVLPDGDGMEPPTGLGWRILIDGPGYHAAARLRVEADPLEWELSLQALTRRQ
jgi:hypothetical protein